MLGLFLCPIVRYRRLPFPRFYCSSEWILLLF
nr:MAG TPA: conotoxin [Caudoviricetes sp.]DAU09360.1 MAG TPA: conotoxin [Caudoviricetes sp.]